MDLGLLGRLYFNLPCQSNSILNIWSQLIYQQKSKDKSSQKVNTSAQKSPNVETQSDWIALHWWWNNLPIPWHRPKRYLSVDSIDRSQWTLDEFGIVQTGNPTLDRVDNLCPAFPFWRKWKLCGATGCAHKPHWEWEMK